MTPASWTHSTGSHGTVPRDFLLPTNNHSGAPTGGPRDAKNQCQRQGRYVGLEPTLKGEDLGPVLLIVVRPLPVAAEPVKTGPQGTGSKEALPDRRIWTRHGAVWVFRRFRRSSDCLLLRPQ